MMTSFYLRDKILGCVNKIYKNSINQRELAPHRPNFKGTCLFKHLTMAKLPVSWTQYKSIKKSPTMYTHVIYWINKAYNFLVVLDSSLSSQACIDFGYVVWLFSICDLTSDCVCSAQVGGSINQPALLSILSRNDVPLSTTLCRDSWKF